MQNLAIVTNTRPNLGLLHINSRDNSPLLVRKDIGALAQRQQATIAAANARKN